MSHVLRLAATATAVVLLAAACTASEPAAGPSATGSPAATAEPTESQTEDEEVEPIVGVRTVRQDSVAPEPVVFNGGQQPEVDTAAVERLARDVGDWIDAHLNDLASGGAGLLQEVGGPGLFDSASPAAVIATTTALVSPDRRVDEAHYRLDVATDGGPLWLRATVRTVGEDGTAATADFVFVPGEGRLVLLAAGPGAEDEA